MAVLGDQKELNMASVDPSMVTNSQLVALHWPPRRRHSRGALSQLLARLGTWRRRVRGRSELARLDERELQDMGLSSTEAYREMAKWFWEE